MAGGGRQITYIYRNGYMHTATIHSIASNFDPNISRELPTQHLTTPHKSNIHDNAASIALYSFFFPPSAPAPAPALPLLPLPPNMGLKSQAFRYPVPYDR